VRKEGNLEFEDFKESGLLELYALNACSSEEKLIVEQFLVSYPELQIELDEINLSLENFADAHSQNLSLNVSSKIKKQLIFKPEIVEIPKVNTSDLKALRLYKFALAASILAIMSLSFVLITTQSKLNKTEDQLALLIQEKLILSEKVNQASFELVDLSQNFKRIESDSFLCVNLKGTEKFPKSQVKVYWNKLSKETFISLINVPKLTKGKQFQLWALVNGKPINAGVFDSLQETLILSNIATSQADLFAITIENSGGSESPTLSEMVVAGNVIGS
jgi:anti-sigma-K factor RskA